MEQGLEDRKCIRETSYKLGQAPRLISHRFSLRQIVLFSFHNSHSQYENAISELQVSLQQIMSSNVHIVADNQYIQLKRLDNLILHQFQMKEISEFNLLFLKKTSFSSILYFYLIFLLIDHEERRIIHFFCVDRQRQLQIMSQTYDFRSA